MRPSRREPPGEGPPLQKAGRVILVIPAGRRPLVHQRSKAWRLYSSPNATGTSSRAAANARAGAPWSARRPGRTAAPARTTEREGRAVGAREGREAESG